MTQRAARRLVDAPGPWHRFAPPGTILAHIEQLPVRPEPPNRTEPVRPEPSAPSQESRIEALCALQPALRTNGARAALYGLLRARRLAELEGFLRRSGV